MRVRLGKDAEEKGSHAFIRLPRLAFGQKKNHYTYTRKVPAHGKAPKTTEGKAKTPAREPRQAERNRTSSHMHHCTLGQARITIAAFLARFA